MISKDKVIMVVNGKIPDRTPYFIEPTRKGKADLARYYGVPIEQMERVMGNDLLYIGYTHPEGREPDQLGNGLFMDEFGCTWDAKRADSVGDWGMLDFPVKDTSLEGYDFPRPEGKGRFREAEKIVEQNPDKFNLLQMLGIFEIPCRFAGMENVMIGMGSEEEFADECFDKALEFNLGILGQLPDYVHGVRFIEDWGDQRGLLMGAKHWRRYLKPRLRTMYEACRKMGRVVSIHSCGNITELIPDLIEMGVEIIDPIQPEVMDLRYIKKEYGKDVVLFGGVGAQSTMPLGTPRQVVEEAEHLLSFMTTGGRYILGSSGAIPTDTPVENMAALIEFCKSL